MIGQVAKVHDEEYLDWFGHFRQRKTVINSYQ